MHDLFLLTFIQRFPKMELHVCILIYVARIAGLFNTEATFSNNSVEIRIDLEPRLTHAGRMSSSC